MTSITPIGVFNNSYLAPKKKQENENQNKEFEAYKEQTNNHILQHEQAHKSAGGALAGSIVIEKNSDGVAFAGHVPISIPEVTPGTNVEESKKQNEQVKTSALAPSDPSGQDYMVAAQAQANINKALMLMQQKQC